MRRKLKQSFLVLIFAIISSNLYCQPILNDSTKTYDYWTKRGIIEMVYASMQDYLATVDTTKFIKENNAAKEYQKKFITNIGIKNEVQLSSDFETVVQFLKNNYWSGLSTKLCIPLIIKQKNKKPLDNLFFTTTISNNKNKKWDERKVLLLNAYQTTLESFKNAPNEIIFDDISTNKPVKGDSMLDKYLTGLVVNILFLLAGIMIGCLLVLLYSKWKIESILSKEKDDYRNELRNSHQNYLFKYIGLVKILYKSKNEKKTEISKLKSEISTLKNLYGNKNNKYEPPIKLTNSATNSKGIELIENKELILEEEKVPNNVIEWTVEPNLKPINILYFTIPEEDGSFKITDGKVTKEKNCFYMIEVDKNSQKGKLVFISSEFDSRALDDIDHYLNPVCEIENITERTHARKIQMKESGNVIISSDSWKIDINHKVKIKFI